MTIHIAMKPSRYFIISYLKDILKHRVGMQGIQDRNLDMTNPQTYQLLNRYNPLAAKHLENIFYGPLDILQTESTPPSCFAYVAARYGFQHPNGVPNYIGKMIKRDKQKSLEEMVQGDLVAYSRNPDMDTITHAGISEYGLVTSKLNNGGLIVRAPHDEIIYAQYGEYMSIVSPPKNLSLEPHDPNRLY